MELIDLTANLNFKEYSRRRHYIFEEIDASFIHFNVVCDIEVERWLTIQEQDYNTPPFTDVSDTIELYNLKCISSEDDKTMMAFTPEEMEHIKEIIINEIENKLERL